MCVEDSLSAEYLFMIQDVNNPTQLIYYSLSSTPPKAFPKW
jgi:hypothetical protein